MYDIGPVDLLAFRSIKVLAGFAASLARATAWEAGITSSFPLRMISDGAKVV